MSDYEIVPERTGMYSPAFLDAWERDWTRRWLEFNRDAPESCEGDES